MKTLSTALLCMLAGMATAQKSIKKIRSVSAITAVANKVFLSAADNVHGEELWISDGSYDGTIMVKDINSGYAPSSPSQMTEFKGKLFFAAYTPQFGQELWTSDGTAAGTMMVKDLVADGGSDPRYLTVFKNHLYFRTSQGIYKSDGTPGGTVQVAQTDYFTITGIRSGNNFLYFTSNHPDEFKRTDGTNVTTIPYPSDNESIYFHSLYTVGDKLFVVMASSYEQTVELYTYEESTGSWKLLKDFQTPLYGDQEIGNFTAVNSRLFFSHRTDFENQFPTDDLWVTDGTVEGTIELRSTTWQKGNYSSEMDHFVAYKDALYFRSGNSDANALWKSDGTPAGTVKVHDVKITRADMYTLNGPVISNDLLWFCGAYGQYTSDGELWYSDGSAQGTKMYADLSPSVSARPYLMTDVNNETLYFVVGDSFAGTTLWNTTSSSDINILTQFNSPVPSGQSLYLNNPQGTSCVKIPLIIQNDGHKELALSDVSVTGTEFYLKGELPEFLNPNEKITIEIYFKPFSTGEKKGELIVRSNDLDEPRYVIKLIGEMNETEVRKMCPDFDMDMVKTIKAITPAKSIALSKSVVEENLPSSSSIGTFSLPGFTGAVTYTFATGNGDTDNNHFSIQGNQLVAASSFDYDVKHLYTVRVKATTAVSSTEERFIIGIVDKAAPFLAEDCKDIGEMLNYGFTDTEFNNAGELFAITNHGRIFRSLNEGVNWESLNHGNWGRLTRIFFKGNTGYITGDYAMLKSEDNGATWFQLYLPFEREITAFFLDESRGFVTGGNGYLYYTDDGGRSWEFRSKDNYAGGVRNPWFFDENNGLAFLGGTILSKTSDGGRHWEAVNVGTNPHWTSIWFLNDKDGFITSYYNTYRTKDGGKTWTGIPEVAGDYLLGIEFSDDKNGYVYGGNYGPLLFATNDGGNSWERKLNYYASGRITGVATSDVGKLISVHEKNYNGLGRSINFSVDNGSTVEALDELPDEDFVKVDFITEEVGYLMSQTSRYKTIDKGMTWKKFNWPQPLSYFHYFDENNALLSDGLIIYKTTDGGITMDEVLVTSSYGDPYAPAGKLYAANDNLIFSYSEYSLHRSVDGGENWQLMTSDNGFYGRDMQFITPTVGYRMELFGSILKTVDAGVTWDLIYERHPLVSDAYHSIYFVDANTGYKGGSKFSKTNDGGVTWTIMYTNFYGDIFDLYFTDAQHGYAATRTRNLYETFDGGLTWIDLVGGSTQDGLYGIQYKHGNINLVGPQGYVSRLGNPGKKPVQAGYAVGPDVVCVGDIHPYHLSENYSGKYQWNVPGAAVNDEGKVAYVQFPHAGDYTFTINNFNTCGVSEPRTQTVRAVELPAPILTGLEVVESSAPVRYDITNLDEGLYYLWDVTGSQSFTNENLPYSMVTWQLTSPDDTHVKVFVADPTSGCSATGSLDVTVEIVLGVEEKSEDIITVYPNPTPAEVTIKSRVDETLLIKLYNSTGMEYFSNELSPSVESKIQLQNLPAGLYILEITNGNGKKITKKIVKE